MAFVHGKGTVHTLNAVDLSAFATEVDWTQTADKHDVTTFGATAHAYQGGLLDGTATLKGVYDNGATGPGKTIRPLIGTVVALVYEPEGIATTKPVHTVNVLVTSYDETAPVADMIKWTCQLQFTGPVVDSSHA
jgi:hypothetical protein